MVKGEVTGGGAIGFALEVVFPCCHGSMACDAQYTPTSAGLGRVVLLRRRSRRILMAAQLVRLVVFGGARACRNRDVGALAGIVRRRWPTDHIHKRRLRCLEDLQMTTAFGHFQSVPYQREPQQAGEQ